MQDMINYMYIETNYEEYEQIQQKKKI